MKTRFWTSHAIRVAALQAAAFGAYSALPFVLPRWTVQTDPIIDAGIFLMLGLFMAMRINRAYERWWEARTQWGTLVNASRNLAVKIRVFAEPGPDEAARIHRLIAGYAYALRDHLRGGADLARLEGFSEDDGKPVHVPSEIVTRLYGACRAWLQAGRITGDEERMLDLEARVFLDVAGACERIRNTPLPPALTWVTRFGLGAFLLVVPWFLRDEFGWLVVPIVGIGSFFVLVSETIATALECPFGTELNQLNLTEISQAIDTSTAGILGVR